MAAPHLAPCVALLEQLVAFDSISHRSNLPLLTFIEAELARAGIASQRIASPCGQKANLLARIGPQAPGGLVLSGHTDVVPVEGQPWDTDPFHLTEKDGLLYGRGTCDMKGFLACCLALAPQWAQSARQKPIYLAFSYDEEIGCLGVPSMARELAAQQPAFALIGEPTLMQVVTAHKGVLSFETMVYGLEAHSSQPQLGVNAVHYGARLVQFLVELGAEIRHSGLRDERFTPPYSTLHVGVMQGGTARNIIPRECYIHWEIRPLPGEDHAGIISRIEAFCHALEAEMQATFAEASIISTPMSRMLGVTLPAHATAQAASVKRAAGTNRELAVSFGTEAGVFNACGIPSIICGPGSIEQAHKPNEFIDKHQLELCLAFLAQLVDNHH
jgi:acetylornithine deacetylase